jgi:hypothetical protein
VGPRKKPEGVKTALGNFREEKQEHTLRKIRIRLRFSQRSPKTEAPDFLVCLQFFRKFSRAETFLSVPFFWWLQKKGTNKK